jgi:hypothetical protein
MSTEALDGMVQRLRAAGATVRPWRAGVPLAVALDGGPLPERHHAEAGVP